MPEPPEEAVAGALACAVRADPGYRMLQRVTDLAGHGLLVAIVRIGDPGEDQPFLRYGVKGPLIQVLGNRRCPAEVSNW